MYWCLNLSCITRRVKLERVLWMMLICTSNRREECFDSTRLKSLVFDGKSFSWEWNAWKPLTIYNREDRLSWKNLALNRRSFDIDSHLIFPQKYIGTVRWSRDDDLISDTFGLDNPKCELELAHFGLRGVFCAKVVSTYVSYYRARTSSVGLCLTGQPTTMQLKSNYNFLNDLLSTPINHDTSSFATD